jgi:hypothetical protein
MPPRKDASESPVEVPSTVAKPKTPSNSSWVLKWTSLCLQYQHRRNFWQHNSSTFRQHYTLRLDTNLLNLGVIFDHHM